MRLRRASLSILLVLAGLPALAQDIRDRITVNGFTEFEFEKQLEKKGFGDPNGSFDSDTIGLVFNVHASDRVRISLESDWSHGADTRAGGGVTLEYGFLEYTVSDLAKVRVGKFLTPFGIFNEVHNIAHSFASVKLPSSTNKTARIIKDAYLFYPRYASGIAAHGDVLGRFRGPRFDQEVVDRCVLRSARPQDRS
jgi:hypothetical protein